ncbi:MULTISPECIES: hypothetical protein [unclassified Halomonas]|uniref:hypothetical protein n=1 Tax=unclassified Halomonas TaxID=2609666 RepID=UPI00054AAC6C|nr:MULTISPECIES: hypothetical protein [unclassified Halomonas]KHJ51641.1 hypothetical protein PZ78_07895 [Halomonas hydrothermalis]UDM08798.1 hypothetical protein LG409_07805 [Halomonas sp. NyZ770]
MSHETEEVLQKRRSRRQVLASLGLGAAALYVAPTFLSMGQAEARGRRSRHSRSRPSYSRPRHKHHAHRDERYYRPYDRRRAGYSRPHRSRWERDGVIEIRLSRVLPRW